MVHTDWGKYILKSKGGDNDLKDLHHFSIRVKEEN